MSIGANKEMNTEETQARAIEALIPLVYDEDDLDPDTRFNHEMAIAVLLLDDVIFLNDYWWMDGESGWPKDACKKPSLNVNLSDVFGWAVADAEVLNYAEIQSLYDHWVINRTLGPIVWGCNKRAMMPIKPIAKKIREDGVWKIDDMYLQSNPTDEYFNE